MLPSSLPCFADLQIQWLTAAVGAPIFQRQVGVSVLVMGLLQQVLGLCGRLRSGLALGLAGLLSDLSCGSVKRSCGLLHRLTRLPRARRGCLQLFLWTWEDLLDLLHGVHLRSGPRASAFRRSCCGLAVDSVRGLLIPTRQIAIPRRQTLPPAGLNGPPLVQLCVSSFREVALPFLLCTILVTGRIRDLIRPECAVVGFNTALWIQGLVLR